MLNKLNTKQSGVGLLEVMFVLVIIGTILLTAGRYLNTTRSTHKSGQALTTILEVSKASDHWLSLFKSFQLGPDGSDPISVERLIYIHALPANFLDNANPWYGDITVVPATLGRPGAPSDVAVLTMTDIPEHACNYIKNTISGQFSDNTGNLACSDDGDYVTLTMSLPISRYTMGG